MDLKKKIIDKETDAVYEILRVEEYPQQLMAVVQPGDKEILIPLSDQLITSIDKPNRVLMMNIPEGLLDL